MRIAVWHNLPSGGGKRALHDQVRGLTLRGHHVEVWCPPTADRSFLPLDGMVREHVIPLDWRAVNSRSPLAETVRWALLDRHRNLREMDRHCAAVAGEIRAGGFDLLLAHGSALMAVAPIARHLGIPTILYLQEPERVLYEAMPDWPWIPPRLRDVRWTSLGSVLRHLGARVLLRYHGDLARAEQENVRAFDRVLVNSLYSRESVLRAHGVDARVCYLGIDTTLFEDRGLAREDFAVGIGSFTPAKNIDLVVRALGRVRGHRPRLVWVGNAAAPGLLEGLEDLAAANGVALEARQQVTNEELVDLLNRASMMIYAPRLEPFGFAPLEGNACGLPVVAVAEGGVRETVTDGVNGLLAQHDPGSIGLAVERLRDDTLLASSLGQEGRRLVSERWSHDAAIDRLERHLSEVAAGGEP
jgi:glycosyltransferase involved in cell wall biosynthesis